jgi:hypothetical protein
MTENLHDAYPNNAKDLVQQHTVRELQQQSFAQRPTAVVSLTQSITDNGVTTSILSLVSFINSRHLMQDVCLAVCLFNLRKAHMRRYSTTVKIVILMIVHRHKHL